MPCLSFKTIYILTLYLHDKEAGLYDILLSYISRLICVMSVFVSKTMQKAVEKDYIRSFKQAYLTLIKRAYEKEIIKRVKHYYSSC